MHSWQRRFYILLSSQKEDCVLLQAPNRIQQLTKNNVQPNAYDVKTTSARSQNIRDDGFKNQTWVWGILMIVAEVIRIYKRGTSRSNQR